MFLLEAERGRSDTIILKRTGINGPHCHKVSLTPVAECSWLKEGFCQSTSLLLEGIRQPVILWETLGVGGNSVNVFLFCFVFIFPGSHFACSAEAIYAARIC